MCWQSHKAELTALQSQLDQAYSDLSELQYNSDQDKAALEDQVQAAQEQIKVRSSDLMTATGGISQPVGLVSAQRPGTLPTSTMFLTVHHALDQSVL